MPRSRSSEAFEGKMAYSVLSSISWDAIMKFACGFFWLLFAPVTAQHSATRPASIGIRANGTEPIRWGGLELSWTDDQANDRMIYRWMERAFFSAIQGTECSHDDAGLHCVRPFGDGPDEAALKRLAADVQNFIELTARVPSLALGTGTGLYSWFWWEGHNSTRVNVAWMRMARTFLSTSIDFSDCGNPELPLQEFYVRNCQMRWRYMIMIGSEIGRYLAVETSDPRAASSALIDARRDFEALRRLPAFGPHAGRLRRPSDVNCNADFFPAAVTNQGPVWKHPTRDVPMAAFLEAHYETILGELRGILSADGRFDSMQRQTKNAEPQFGPRDDDWQTAYLARGGEFLQQACQFAPKTCALMRSRPEVAECKGSVSGVGFLRLQPGARLKPHYGNSPRLAVHLGLIVPPGDIRMVVGGEVVRWVAGKAIVFDDTFVHSVRHDGLESRYVFLTWMCHPCDPTNGRGSEESTEVPEFCQGPEHGVLPPDTFRKH
eukprot:TRINITY_DN5254_c0_g2_i1.p1 TRINITY_DN5254_c0_g2~~TRINITY_DN5254_c0_g2_i1.p1  ORF type:complete len:491 (-),score=57.46 TRINITY_DN5254_c0_g2_i1:143-1615(-)